MRNAARIALGVATVLALAACGSSSNAPLDAPASLGNNLSGTLSADECGGGYDIANANVEVRDEADKIIGAGNTSGDTGSGVGCMVEFAIADLPDADFYQITIGTHDGPTYTMAELDALNWNLELSLS
jgi:hypothetical protein